MYPTDVQYLKERIPEIAVIAPESYNGWPVSARGKEINRQVHGTTAEFADLRTQIPQPGGRFLNPDDVAKGRKVAFIGWKVARDLFGAEDPIGQKIVVNRVPFMVVGVMEKKTQNSSYNRRDADRVFIPASTFASVFGASQLSTIIYTPKDPTRSEEVNEQVRTVLSKRYRFDASDRDAVWIWDTTEFDKFLFYFFLAFNIFMGLIGSFTLGVGGIGVANIMYIVVQERVTEIGIKRAVGATKGDILFQFFMETFFIIAIGSTIGFLIALGIAQAMQFVPIKDFVGTPEISIEVALATAFVLAMVGLAAGLFPARRAASLNVVECLRG